MYGRILRQSFVRQRGRKLLALAAITAGMTVATAMLVIRTNAGDDLSRELHRYGVNLTIVPAAASLPVRVGGVDLRPARSGAYLNLQYLPRLKSIFWEHNILAFTPELFVKASSNGQAIPLEGAYFSAPVARSGHARPMLTGLEALAPAWKIYGRWPEDQKIDDARQIENDPPKATETTLNLRRETPLPEALAGIRLARRMGWHRGQGIEVQTSRAHVMLRLSGIVSTGGAEDRELITPLQIAQQLAGRPGQARRVLVSALTKPPDAFSRENPDTMTAAEKERWMCSPYARSIAAQITQIWPGARVNIVRKVEDGEGRILNKVNLLLLLLTVMSLIAGGLAIASVMTAAVSERQPEIALMKAIGAGDGAIGRLFLLEAGILGLAGGGLGFGLGEGLAALISRQVLGYAAHSKPVLAPLMLALAVIVALIGCAQPLRRAMKLDPANALR